MLEESAVVLRRPTNRRRKNRGRLHIVAAILQIAEEGCRKTRIMYLGNLSFELLRKYLDILVKRGLLEVQDRGEKIYRTTEKGRHFLQEFQELQRDSEVMQSKRQAVERYLTG